MNFPKGKVQLDNAAQASSNVAADSFYLPIYGFKPRSADWWKDGSIPAREVQDGSNRCNPELVPESKAALASEFDDRAERWERESAIHSAPASKFLHKDYQWIISRGKAVVPLILNRLQTSKKDWFWALEQLTDVNPARYAESFGEAARLWLEWGRDKHYLD